MPLVIALVVLPTASSSVRICAPSSCDVAGHLRDALGVVGDRAEGVHRDDDTDRGQQAAAGERDREQRDRAADQGGAEHRCADHDRGVDGRLEADGQTGQDHRGRAGQRGAADILDRAVVGAGEVAGQRQDRGGQHDADHHGHGRDHARAGVGGVTGRSDQVAPLAGQVDERQDRARHGRDRCRDVERTVDGDQAVLAGAGAAEVDAGHRGQGADRRDQQREDQALLAERGHAEDQRRDQRHGVRLEEVGGHAGAVADVVADVVGDRGGVARVVLGDVLLDLADQVGADVGGLGEDAATDTHEHGEQGRAEAEALEHVRGLVLEGEDDDARAEEAEADGRHTDEGAGPEADRHRRVAALVAGRGRYPEVGADGQGHAEVPDRCREAGADQEEDRAEDPHHGVVGGQSEQQEERHGGEDAEGPELPGQVGAGAFLHRVGDVLHVVGALTGGKHFLAEHPCHRERAKRDQADDGYQGQAASGELHDGGIDPGHVVPPGSDSGLRRRGVYAEVWAQEGPGVTGDTRKEENAHAEGRGDDPWTVVSGRRAPRPPTRG